MGEMSSGNLLGTRKLTEKSIDRSCVESWNFSSSENRMVTRRETDYFRFAHSLTLSNLYLESDFSSSLWYALSV